MGHVWREAKVKEDQVGFPATNGADRPSAVFRRANIIPIGGQLHRSGLEDHQTVIHNQDFLQVHNDLLTAGAGRVPPLPTGMVAGARNARFMVSDRSRTRSSPRLAPTRFPSRLEPVRCNLRAGKADTGRYLTRPQALTVPGAS